MIEEQILAAVTKACQDEKLCFQAIFQNDCVYLYINREPEVDCDYQKLVEILSQAIRDLEIGNLQGIWFYSRILGEVESDWQTFVEIGSSGKVVTEVIAEKTEEISLEEELSTQKSEPISKVEEKSDLDLEKENLDSEETELTAKKYCFIKNKRLLEAELIPPSIKIAEIVRNFANFPEEVIKPQLPILENYFLQGQDFEPSQENTEIQTWLLSILELNNDDKRKIAIWLSRYYHNETETKEIIDKVFQAQAEIDNYREEDSAIAEEDNKPLPSSSTYSYRKTYSNSAEKVRVKPPQKKHPNKLIALPIAWTLVTLIIIIIGFSSYNPSNASPAICDSSEDNYSYCVLASQIFGEQGLKAVTKNANPFNQESFELSLGMCEIYGNIAAGLTFQEATNSRNAVLSVNGTEILPGIYFVDVEQNNYQEESELEDLTVRTTCTFQQNNNKNVYQSLNLLGTEQIDPAWPEVAYEPTKNRKSLQALNNALGAYSFFSNFGLNTLFTAIIIYFLAVFGLAIKANSLETIYQAAFILGIIESLLGYLPVIGWLIQIPLECIALGITSACIKGFTIDWSAGYRFVSATALILIVTRIALNWSFLYVLFLIFS